MAKQRILVDVVLIALVLLIAAGAWWWKDRQLDHQAEEHRFHVEQLQARAQEWAEAMARGEAEAVARAFASGVTPMALSQNLEGIDQAVVGLLDVSGVVFVHVLDPQGGVLASSDRKLVTTGTAGGEAAWALGTQGLQSRRSDRAGVLELASPIVGGGGTTAVLWMGYQVRQRIEEAKPASLVEGSPEMGGPGADAPDTGEPAPMGEGGEDGEGGEGEMEGDEEDEEDDQVDVI